MTTSTISLEEYLKEVAQWKSTVDALQKQVKYLEEQLEWFKKQIFGKRSERIVEQGADAPCFPGLEEFFKQTAEEEKQKVPAHDRKKPNRNGQDAITFPSDLPIERHVIDIPEEDKVCPETDLPLIKIGEEVTTKLAHKPGSYYLKQIVRPKYALPSKSSEGGIVTAELPDSLLNRCQADES